MANGSVKRAIQPMAVLMGSQQTSATFEVGNFSFGFLIGYYRDANPSGNTLSGYCIIYTNNNVAYIDAKTEFTALNSVSFGDGILTVNTNIGYMTLTFLPLY